MPLPYGPESPGALVLGRGITALGALRSLGRVGLRPFLVGDEDFVTYSRWYRSPLPPDFGPPAEGALTEVLAKVPFPKMMLLPCSDEWATAVRSLPPETAQRFPSSLPPASALHALIDKGGFAELLASLGLAHPHTLRVSDPADLQAIPEDFLARAFLKPRRSQAFARLFGVKAFRFRTREEARARLRDAVDAGCEMLLQEYIPGPPTAHCFIDGFVDGRGEMRARFARRRLRMDPPDFGNSTYMVSVPLEEVADAVATLDRLLAHVGYRGIFSAEFKRDPQDGRFKILEVNTRAWWYVEFATDCGVNVCEMAYRDALGLPVGTVARYAVGVRCVYPYYDWGSWRHGKDAGRPPLPRLLLSWLGARQPIFRWADPLPALASATQYLGELFRRRWPA